MGEFVLDTSVGMEGADEAQHHYRASISPDDTDLLGTIGLSDRSFIYRGTLRSADQGPEADHRFLDATRAELVAGGWESYLLQPVSSPAPE